MFRDPQKQDWKTQRCCLKGCWREALYRGLCRDHLDESLRLTLLVTNHLLKFQKGA